MLNGYWTSMLSFKDNATEADCWFGGLVAAGIAPQINSDSGSAKLSLAPRVRWWLDLFRRYGAATESSVVPPAAALHVSSFQSQPFARAHCSVARCPPRAA